MEGQIRLAGKGDHPYVIKMALAHPRFAGHLRLAGHVKGEHVHHSIGHIIEVYLDYVCPFSAKMFFTLYRV